MSGQVLDMDRDDTREADRKSSWENFPMEKQVAQQNRSDYKGPPSESGNDADLKPEHRHA
jgi:hypothetical protein